MTRTDLHCKCEDKIKFRQGRFTVFRDVNFCDAWRVWSEQINPMNESTEYLRNHKSSTYHPITISLLHLHIIPLQYLCCIYISYHYNIFVVSTYHPTTISLLYLHIIPLQYLCCIYISSHYNIFVVSTYHLTIISLFSHFISYIILPQQWFPTCGPRAKSGPPGLKKWPSTS